MRILYQVAEDKLNEIDLKLKSQHLIPQAPEPLLAISKPAPIPIQSQIQTNAITNNAIANGNNHPPLAKKNTIINTFTLPIQDNKIVPNSVKWIERRSTMNNSQQAAGLVPALNRQNGPGGKRQSMHDFQSVGKSLVGPLP